jgi:hypothetical protein
MIFPSWERIKDIWEKRSYPVTADRSTTELRWNHFSPNGGDTVRAENKLRQVVSIARKLVAGAGFEPAIRQARDYEPNRDRLVIL